MSHYNTRFFEPYLRLRSSFKALDYFVNGRGCGAVIFVHKTSLGGVSTMLWTAMMKVQIFWDSVKK